MDTLLQQISAMLNSNEQFEMDDSFQLSLTHVRTPLMGSSGKHKLKPGHSALTSFKQRSCLYSSLRTETSFVVPEPSSLPKPELTNTPTATGSKEAEGSKQNMNAPSQKHSSSSTMMAITTSSLLYLDSLAPPTSA